MNTKSYRKKYLETIEKDFPSMYEMLKQAVPDLVSNPDNASEDDISSYNTILLFQIGKLTGLRF